MATRNVSEFDRSMYLYSFDVDCRSGDGRHCSEELRLCVWTRNNPIKCQLCKYWFSIDDVHYREWTKCVLIHALILCTCSATAKVASACFCSIDCVECIRYPCSVSIGTTMGSGNLISERTHQMHRRKWKTQMRASTTKINIHRKNAAKIHAVFVCVCSSNVRCLLGFCCVCGVRARCS